MLAWDEERGAEHLSQCGHVESIVIAVQSELVQEREHIDQKTKASWVLEVQDCLSSCDQGRVVVRGPGQLL